LGQTAIVQELARRGIHNRCGRPYTPDAVGAVIRGRARQARRPGSETNPKSEESESA